MSHYQNFTPPFEIHDSWEWVRLDDIAQSNIGLTYKPTDVSKDGTPVYRSNNIQNRSICKDDIVRVNSEILSNQFLHEGDLLICARNGSRRLVGKNAIIQKLDEPTSFGAFMAVCRSAYNSWIHILLNTRYFDRYLDASNSTAINQVTQKMLLDFTIPFPPIREQNRIISILSMWFNILDDMDKKSEDLKTTISNTKSKILELAMQGKLVPQNPTDEPAADMLLRVNPKARIITDNPHYPKWLCSYMGDVCEFERGITFPSNTKRFDKVPGYIACLRTANVHDEVDLSSLWYISEEYLKGTDAKKVKVGDVLMSTANSKELVGRSVLIRDLSEHTTFGGFVTVLRTQILLPEFFTLFLKYKTLKGDFSKIATQTTNIANLNTRILSTVIIPVPPTEEQSRIIQRVNRLFSVLDEIEASLLS